MAIKYLEKKFRKDIFKEKDYKVYSNTVSSDPILSETEKKKKNLMLIACITILITIYSLKIKLPWIEIDDANIQIEHVKGLIGTLLIYSYLNYFLNALIDIRKWKFSEEMINTTSHIKYLKLLTSNFTYIENRVHDIRNRINQSNASYNYSINITELARNAATFNNDLSQKILTLKTSNTKLKFLIYSRTAIFEIVIPCSLGIYGTFQVSNDIISFLSIPLLNS